MFKADAVRRLNLKVAFVNPNLGYFAVPNIGLAYVISSVQRQHDVRLIDLTFYGRNFKKYLASQIRDFLPDVVGISANSFTINDSFKIASAIKCILPRVKIILGGLHPTLFPMETLEHDCIDAVCRGEGENSFLEFLKNINRGPRASQIQGILEKGATAAGEILPCQDLEDIPAIDWRHWDIARYASSSNFFIEGLIYLASRGCPYDCAFCSNPVLRKMSSGNFYRAVSAQKVVREISESFEKYPKYFKRVIFIDPVFGLDKNWLKDFKELFVTSGLSRRLNWICQTRADVVSQQWCAYAKEAGCMLVDLGVESGSESFRFRTYNKRITDRKISEAVSLFEKHNIAYRFNMIVGAPGEERKEIHQTLNFSRNFNPSGVRYTIYQPLPKTALSEGKMPSGFSYAKKVNLWDYATPRRGYRNANFINFIMLKIRFKRYLRIFNNYIKLGTVRAFKNAFFYILNVKGRRPLPAFTIYAYSNWLDRMEQEILIEKINNKQKD